MLKLLYDLHAHHLGLHILHFGAQWTAPKYSLNVQETWNSKHQHGQTTRNTTLQSTFLVLQQMKHDKHEEKFNQ